jgi:hypothetical protein
LKITLRIKILARLVWAENGKMTFETKYFDIAQHLNTTEEIRAFLQEVLETEMNLISLAKRVAGSHAHGQVTRDPGNPQSRTEPARTQGRQIHNSQ